MPPMLVTFPVCQPLNGSSEVRELQSVNMYVMLVTLPVFQSFNGSSEVRELQ